MNLLALKVMALAGVAASVAMLTYVSTAAPARPRPRLGRRGSERLVALSEQPIFALFEPLLCFMAGLVARLPVSRARARHELDLLRAGYPLGLTVDEYLALLVLSAIALAAIALVLLPMAGLSPVGGLFGAAVGGLLPSIQVRERSLRRSKEITRALPHAIEIAAMCMGAGLDFPGALRQLSKSGSGRESTPLALEFAAILEELELGHTRREALRNFASRVPSPAVRDFVNAVVQADEKGSPLAEVLKVQGRMLSMRRSVAAEEAAARAGVLMMVPMIFLVGCILLILMGPFMVKGLGF